MNRLSVFLMIMLIIGVLTITASGINNGGTYELANPEDESIERVAYDSDDSVWSEANTSLRTARTPPRYYGGLRLR